MNDVDVNKRRWEMVTMKGEGVVVRSADSLKPGASVTASPNSALSCTCSSLLRGVEMLMKK